MEHIIRIEKYIEDLFKSKFSGVLEIHFNQGGIRAVKKHENVVINPSKDKARIGKSLKIKKL